MLIHLIIDTDDFPSLSSIKGTISRLNKDIEIIKKYGGMLLKNECPPEDLSKVCMFLETLSKRFKKHFPKQTS